MKSQQQFISELVESQAEVIIYLINGVRLQGTLKEFDEDSIILHSPTIQLIYKHAISSILRKDSV